MMKKTDEYLIDELKEMIAILKQEIAE